MWQDRNRNHVSTLAVGLFVVCAAVGFGIASAIGNRVPLCVGIAIGVYLLFSIKVADQ